MNPILPTLSATIGPDVALVSAAITTPPSKIHPTIVVPVLVAFGKGTPWACRAAFRLWLEKSKPGMLKERRLRRQRDWVSGKVYGEGVAVRASISNKG